MMRFLCIPVGLASCLIGGILADEDQRWTAAFGISGLALIMLPFIKKPSREEAEERSYSTSSGSWLDKVLFKWNAEGDSFMLRDLLSGGVAIFGQTGSGKTSSTGRRLAESILRHPSSGGLILAAKPEDRAMWQKLFKAAGREHDLLVFGNNSRLRCNFIDYIRQMGWDAREMAKMLMVIGEGLNANDAKKGEESDFWEKQQFRMIYFACLVVQVAYGKISATDIQKFISGSARNAEQIKDATFSKSYHAETIRIALNNPIMDREKHDLSQAVEYFLGELPNLADRTRSSVETGVFGILHVFCTGAVHDLIGTTTNVTPDVMLDGKFILVDLPISETGDLGQFVGGGFKYLTQRMMLKRSASDGDAINVIWCDEAQTRLSSYDAHYLAQCRSHLGCMVYLTQSLHSYYSALPGESGKSQAQALLSNFKTKVAHSIGDEDTAKYLTGLIGKEKQTFTGGSMAPSKDTWDELFGENRFTGNFSEQVTDILQPNELMAGLRTGGPEHGFMCDAFVFRSGLPFASGRNFIRVAISQKG